MILAQAAKGRKGLALFLYPDTSLPTVTEHTAFTTNQTVSVLKTAAARA